MTINDFLDVKDYSFRLKLRKTTHRPYLSKFCEAHFIRGSKKMYYKTKFDEEQTKLCILMAKSLKGELPQPTVRTPRG